MKRLICFATMTAFALALHAGDGTADKPACCAKTKTGAEQTKAECPMMTSDSSGGCCHADKDKVATSATKEATGACCQRLLSGRQGQDGHHGSQGRHRRLLPG
jgi:hypothetical protein